MRKIVVEEKGTCFLIKVVVAETGEVIRCFAGLRSNLRDFERAMRQAEALNFCQIDVSAYGVRTQGDCAGGLDVTPYLIRVYDEPFLFLFSVFLAQET